jgi:hypothetical protein
LIVELGLMADGRRQGHVCRAYDEHIHLVGSRGPAWVPCSRINDMYPSGDSVPVDHQIAGAAVSSSGFRCPPMLAICFGWKLMMIKATTDLQAYS